MGAADDRIFLERIADASEANGNPIEAGELRAISKRIENPQIETVEQGVLFRKSPTIPDGASWADVGEFTGYYSGIRLQKGEPFVELRGHLVFLRQAELSFTPRQVPIYELASALRSPAGGTVAIAVVFGFNGERSGLVWFRDGKQGPLEPLSGADDLKEALETQLKWMVANAVAKDRLNRERKPKQGEISDADLP